MIKSISDRIFRALEAFFQPERQLLAPYARQRPRLRQEARAMIGVVLVGILGAAYGYYFAALPPAYLLFLLAPLAALVLIIIWVLPDQGTAPTAMMVKLLWCFFVVSIIWPDYIAIQLPGLPWISMRRMFLAPMCLLLLVAISISSSFRSEMKTYAQADPLIWRFFLGFLTIQCLSLILADSKPTAIKNLANYQTVWTAVFFVSVYAFQDQRRITRFFKLFLGCCLLIGVIGICEAFNRRVLWVNHIPWFLQVDPLMLRGAMASAFRNGLYRARSVFANPLPFAEIMALSSPIILYFIFRTKSVLRRYALGLFSIFILGVLMLPQARLGLVGFIASYVLFIFIWTVRRWMRNRVSIIGPATTLAYPALILALCIAVMSVGSLRERVIGGSDTVYSNQSRKQQQRQAFSVIVKSPIFGHGPREGAATLGYRGGADGKTLTLDNYLLWIALDYGLVGFIFYYGMILLMIHRLLMIALKSEREESDQALLVVAMLSTFLLIKTVLSEEDNHSLLFILLGMGMAMIRRDKLATPEPPVKIDGRNTPLPI